MKFKSTCWVVGSAVVGCSGLVSGVAVGSEINKLPKQPNILFIFSDDHACNAISAYGSKINKTPNIDRLAADGMLFENSFCANAICGPSRACVLSGKHSHINGFKVNWANHFDHTQSTFVKSLRQGGYQTALIGKWHLGGGSGEKSDFEHWDIWSKGYYNPNFCNKDGATQVEGYSTTLITDKVIEWIGSRDQSKPFVAMCTYNAPHRTWAPEPKYLNRYKDADIPEPATLFDNWENRSKTLAENRMSIDKHLYYSYDLKVLENVPFASERENRLKSREYRRMSAADKAAWDAAYGPENKAFIESKPTGKELISWKYQRYIKDYLRCVDSLDDAVGRLRDYLESEGLSENTIIIYSSDQGFYLGEHGWYDKRWMFEESFRMPFIISWPGVTKPGSHRTEMIQNIDYAPTFIAAAGLSVPADMQGESLLPLLKGEEVKDWRRSVYYHFYEGGGEHNAPRHEGVRTDRYKLIHYYKTGEWDLFDLKNDPREMRSVYDNPEYAGTRKKMHQELVDIRKQYDCTE